MPSTDTTFDTAKIPIPIRAVVTLMTTLDSLGIPVVNLDLNKAKAAAEEKTGLHDWNDQHFLDDLEKLIDFVKRSPTATSLLKINFRNDLMRRLTNYLKLQEFKKTHPDLASQSVGTPLIIAGLPRTGTTLLHRLLAQDPASHGPALWELFAPIDSVTPSADSRRKDTEGFVNMVRNTSLTLWSIHPTYANEADECYFLLPQSLGDVFIYTGIDYWNWFSQRSAIPDYELYKQYLQAMHYGQRARRWVLKTPVHTPKFDDLLTVFPNAQIIWCHRGLSHVIASWVSFAAVSRKLTHKTVDPVQLGREWVEIWSQSLKEAQKARDHHPASQFFDVNYDDLVLDPMGMVRKIYTYFGLELTVAAEAKMKAWLEKDRQQERLGHRYTLDRYGLSPEILEREFADYIRRYDVSID